MGVSQTARKIVRSNFFIAVNSLPETSYRCDSGHSQARIRHREYRQTDGNRHNDHPSCALIRANFDGNFRS